MLASSVILLASVRPTENTSEGANMPVPPEAATAWFAAVRKELTIAAAQEGAFCKRARKKPI